MSDRGSGAGVFSDGRSTPEEVRVGVYVCHCGGNISDVVDVQRVAAELGRHPGVAHSVSNMFTCSDAGQAEIEEDIRTKHLNRIVVAACSPSLHERTFRRTLARAGLNPYLYEHVNIREHVSWVVEDKRLATRKALRLIRAAVDRVSHQIPLEKRQIPIRPSALVIGGGISGLIAARDLGRRGMQVTLVEKSAFLGGRMAQLGSVFPTRQNARELLHAVVQEVSSAPNVTVYTNVEVIDSRGFVGDYTVTVRRTPRGVSKDLRDPSLAIAACPVETDNEFDHGLTRRKAIYRPYEDCAPEQAAIDWRVCTKCGDCVEAAKGKGISLDDTPEQFEIRCGVIVLSTGFNPYVSRRGEYGTGEYPAVISLAQLSRMLDPQGPTGGRLATNGNTIRNVALIHCVGSRQHDGVHEPQDDGNVNEYCSRVCCTALLHAANDIKDRFPHVNVFDFHEDIRTYGLGHEEYYTDASRKGVIFLRFDGRAPPVVERDPTGDSSLVVRCKDRLTNGLEVEVPADLVVLGTGVMPRDMSNLFGLFRCAVGQDRFLLEVHPKLRPVELAVAGIFLAGTVQGPMNISESTAAASAAAAKAAALMAKGVVELDPFIAEVNAERCTGCRSCLYVCPFEAIQRNDEKEVAEVNPALCTGCGTCVATCPSDVIWQFGFSDDQITAELEALLDSEAATGTV